MAKLCNGFTHQCHNLSHVQPTRTIAHDRVVRASAGTSSYQDVSTAVECRRVLGVGPNASRCEVKAAYRKLALQLHPDVCRGGECQVNFVEVNKAYESLMALPSFCDSASSPQPEVDDDDPWADFLQSLVSGYRREDFSSYYSNLKYYSKPGRGRRYSGSSQYQQGI